MRENLFPSCRVAWSRRRWLLVVLTVLALPLMAFAAMSQREFVPTDHADKFVLRACSTMSDPSEDPCDHCVYIHYIYYKPAASIYDLNGYYTTSNPQPGVTRYSFTGPGTVTISIVPGPVEVFALEACDYVTDSPTKVVISYCTR